jgi:polysaccharide biosynthesis/export protein
MRLTARLGLWILAMSSLGATLALPAAAQALSAEQQRIIEQLPESQRVELMRSMGVVDAGQSDRAPEFPELLRVPERRDDAPGGPQRLRPGQTVIVDLQLPARLEDDAERMLRVEEKLRRNPQLEVVRGAATYVLDESGHVHFPGIASVRLAGLTEKEAERRLEAEPNLRPYQASVMLLPLQRFGADALEPFGYELFRGAPVTFAPATDIPVPVDYVIGPGDHVRVQLFGKENASYELAVSRDGTLEFPRLGPIVVAGLTFGDMRQLLQERVSEQMVGVAASITMGELRSIRVFVLGDVTRPGSFTVSGLSTMTHALFVSGGLRPSGSMRAVQLKRDGKTVTTLDLYDLLLHGDTRNDARLMPNDVLFVPPKGTTVSVYGEVQRPAVYELARERSLEQVITLAGGLTATAFPGELRIERLDPKGGRTVQTVDYGTRAGRQAALADGDLVAVGSVLEILTDHVVLAGHVHRPGSVEWRQGMTLTDLIGSFDHLKPSADRHYVLIRRQQDLSGPIEVFSADLAAALATPKGLADPPLRNLDQITVFDLGSGRVAVLDPLIDELRRQAVFGDPAREVSIGGMVRAPGTYPLEVGMRVSDLIRAGASLSDSAFGLAAELTRYEVRDGTRRLVDLVQVDLAQVLAGDPMADLLLQPYDFISIKQVSGWRRQGVIELRGEVRFPGAYPIEPGERLSNVIRRAGGLTELAFPQGSVFLREELRRREREEIERLVARMEADLAALALQANRAASVRGAQSNENSMAVGQSILAQLRRAQPMGRLVVDLPQALAGDDAHDLLVRDGDRLYIPERSQEVMILGEVQYPTSHVFQPGKDWQAYVGLSGGLTRNADEARLYIVRANGAVVANEPGSRRSRRALLEVQPGDSIVVPMNVDRVPALALWQSSTAILFNLAVAVAAIGSL